MILIIDNYDSFTYNLYQAISVINNDVLVVRNDAITIEEIKCLKQLQGIVLSPGPGHPKDSGLCVEVITKLGTIVPILGICLGHQAIGVAFGGVVNKASEILHGKQSLIFHNRLGIFKDMQLPFQAGRYHSLIVEKASLSKDLQIDAIDKSGNIMALSHRKYPIFGVQFHPESILTPAGEKIFENFMEICNAN